MNRRSFLKSIPLAGAAALAGVAELKAPQKEKPKTLMKPYGDWTFNYPDGTEIHGRYDSNVTWRKYPGDVGYYQYIAGARTPVLWAKWI